MPVAVAAYCNSNRQNLDAYGATWRGFAARPDALGEGLASFGSCRVRMETEMGRHGHNDGGNRDCDGYDRRDDRERLSGPLEYEAPTRPRRKLPMSVILVGLIIWSLLAWIAYSLVDPALGWLAASASLLVDGGKSIATATGGKEVSIILANINVSGGFWRQAIAFLEVVLKPVIIIVWAIGALILAAASFILPKIGRLFAARRH